MAKRRKKCIKGKDMGAILPLEGKKRKRPCILTPRGRGKKNRGREKKKAACSTPIREGKKKKKKRKKPPAPFLVDMIRGEKRTEKPEEEQAVGNALPAKEEKKRKNTTPEMKEGGGEKKERKRIAEWQREGLARRRGFVREKKKGGKRSARACRTRREGGRGEENWVQKGRACREVRPRKGKKRRKPGRLTIVKRRKRGLKKRERVD